MIRIEFAQPDGHGRLLTIVEALTAKERSCDLALIRMASEAVALLPEWHRDIPSDFEQHLSGEATRSMYLDTVDRDPRTWAEAGYEVIDHHRGIPLHWTPGTDSGKHLRIVRTLLSHPLWLAAKEAHAIRCIVEATREPASECRPTSHASSERARI